MTKSARMTAADSVHTPPRLHSLSSATADSNSSSMLAMASASSTCSSSQNKRSRNNNANINGSPPSAIPKSTSTSASSPPQQLTTTTPPTLTTASSAMVHALFGETMGPCWGNFECSHTRIPGRMYAVTSGILFYSNWLGFERRLYLQFADIASMALHRTTSLRIELKVLKKPTNHNSSNSEDNDNTTRSNEPQPQPESYIFRSFTNREQTLQLLIGLKRLADERLLVSGKPARMQLRSQSERLPSRETFSFGEGDYPEDDKDDDDDGKKESPTNRAEAAGSTSSNNSTHNTELDSFSLSPTPPRLKRSAISDVHLDHGSIQTNGGSQQYTPSPVPPTPSRRRAVSDSLVRFLGLDGEVRPVPTTDRDQLLDTLDPAAAASPERSAKDTAAVANDDIVEKAWKAANAQAAELDEIGIESLRLSCSLDTFYSTFLADNAPFSFDRFQRENIQDHDVIVTPWQPHNKDDNNEQQSSPRHDNSNAQIRTLSFTHPIKKGSVGVGPSEAHTQRSQIVRRYDPLGITFQNTTHVEGIPAADCFSVHDFWTIASAGDSSVVVSVRFAARFTKRTLFRNVIERNIKRETKEWFASFSKMAHAALEQTTASTATLPLDEASERTAVSAVAGKPGESETILGGMDQDRLWLWLRSVYWIIVLGLIIVALVLVALILQVVQTHEALSILEQETVALRQENQQLLQFVLQLQHQQIASSAANTLTTLTADASQTTRG